MTVAVLSYRSGGLHAGGQRSKETHFVLRLLMADLPADSEDWLEVAGLQVSGSGTSLHSGQVWVLIQAAAACARS